MLGLISAHRASRMATEFNQMSNRELVDTYLQVIEKLRCRGLMPISGNLTGGLAESIACQALSLVPRQRNARDIDAVSHDGNFSYQIKGRRGQSPMSIRSGLFHGLESRPFDFLVAVTFDMRYLVRRALVVPYDTAWSKAKPNSRGDAHYIDFNATLAGADGVYDFLRLIDTVWRPPRAGR